MQLRQAISGTSLLKWSISLLGDGSGSQRGDERSLTEDEHLTGGDDCPSSRLMSWKDGKCYADVTHITDSSFQRG